MQVLIIEDTAEVVEIIEVALKLRWPEWDVASVVRGGMAPGSMAALRPNLIILDLGLPDMDGLDLLEQIRRISDVPVIILTSRSHEAARVRGLEAGADDYILKPFSSTELLARVRAVVRRAEKPDSPGGQSVITRGLLTVDLGQRSVSVNDRFVPFSRLEWGVLSCLASNAGKVVLHDELKRSAWGSTSVGDSVVKMCVRRIRTKLSRAGGSADVIVTHRGTGYSFTA